MGFEGLIPFDYKRRRQRAKRGNERSGSIGTKTGSERLTGSSNGDAGPAPKVSIWPKTIGRRPEERGPIERSRLCSAHEFPSFAVRRELPLSVLTCCRISLEILDYSALCAQYLRTKCLSFVLLVNTLSLKRNFVKHLDLQKQCVYYISIIIYISTIA